MSAISCPCSLGDLNSITLPDAVKIAQILSLSPPPIGIPEDVEKTKKYILMVTAEAWVGSETGRLARR